MSPAIRIGAWEKRNYEHIYQHVCTKTYTIMLGMGGISAEGITDLKKKLNLMGGKMLLDSG